MLTPRYQRIRAKPATSIAIENVHYRDLAPLDANGAVDESTGIVQFIVGTGGRDLRSFDDPPLAVTALRNASTWGVLRLDLYSDHAKYKFVPIAGQTFTDEGEIACH